MKIVLVCALLLAGCGPVFQTDNDSIIRETKKCHDAGMNAGQWASGAILCMPKESESLKR